MQRLRFSRLLNSVYLLELKGLFTDSRKLAFRLKVRHLFLI